MILTKYLKIKIKTHKHKNIYNNLGYACDINDEIYVKVEDFSNHSHFKIDVKCDNCGEEKELKIQVYNKATNNNTEPFYCKNKECINKKRKLATQKKYGVDNVFQLKEVKDKIIETNLERYGVENPQQNRKIKLKTNLTNLGKYGVENVFQSEKIKEKIKETNLERYGVEYPQQSEEIRSKNSTLHKSSAPEKELTQFIIDNYDYEYILNDMKILNGFQLDLYLPNSKLAFEFNGLYWHNELTKDNNYHKIKTDKCLKKDIQLIHVWEDDWQNKKDIVKSIILNKLGKTENKIYARKCEIKNVGNELSRKFLNKNHIQENIGSNIKLGLFYNDELVSLMTFGKNRIFMKSNSEEIEYELLRFCNKLNTNVIGGASKLFKYFLNIYKPKNIVSYADRSYSNGNLYKQLGFDFIHISKPNYYYLIKNKRYHKINFRKHKLIKQGFVPNKSEHEIMLERKIYRIYDAGKMKFIFEKQKFKIH